MKTDFDPKFYFYLSADGNKQNIKRYVEPMAIVFSDFYFYLIAFPFSYKGGISKHWFDFPTVYRMDRITYIEGLDIKFTMPYSSRFQEGEFMNRIQFMQAGELNRLVIKYTGVNIEAILVRFPTAEIMGQDGEGVIVRVEAFGDGIYMWALSQGNNVEIINPISSREKMKEVIKSMAEKYDGHIEYFNDASAIDEKMPAV